MIAQERESAPTGHKGRDLITLLLLFMWPTLLMTSAFLFDAPGPRSVNPEFIVIGIFLYPLVLLGIYWQRNWTFLGMPPKRQLKLTGIVYGFIFVCWLWNFLPNMMA